MVTFLTGQIRQSTKILGRKASTIESFPILKQQWLIPNVINRFFNAIITAYLKPAAISVD